MSMEKESSEETFEKPQKEGVEMPEIEKEISPEKIDLLKHFLYNYSMVKLLAKEKSVLFDFKKKVKSVFKKDNPRLILFGSKARGDFKPYSDTDVIVVLKKLTLSKKRVVSDFATDIFLDKNIDISPHIYSEKEFKELLALETPFMLSVKKDGVKI